MAKFQAAILIFAIALAIVVAEPVRRRSTSNARLVVRPRSRVLARQEVEESVPEVVTPYPTADELKPEVPFEEEVVGFEDVPQSDEPQPDEVYGPPEFSFYTPDEIYGPPELDVAATETVDEFNARLIAARRSAALRQRQASYRQAVAAKRSAKLRAAVAAKRRA